MDVSTLLGERLVVVFDAMARHRVAVELGIKECPSRTCVVPVWERIADAARVHDAESGTERAVQRSVGVPGEDELGACIGQERT